VVPIDSWPTTYESDPPSYNCYIHEPDEPSECIDVPVSQLQTCLVAIAETISGGTLAAAVRRCFEGDTMRCAPEASSSDAWPATDR
jgi:hypothetical protein